MNIEQENQEKCRIGFIFARRDPKLTHPIYERLTTKICKKPELWHYDPETIEMTIINSKQQIVPLKLSRSTNLGAIQVVPGIIRLNDRKDKSIVIFNFGSKLIIEHNKETGQKTTIITSKDSTPILNPQNKEQLILINLAQGFFAKKKMDFINMMRDKGNRTIDGEIIYEQWRIENSGRELYKLFLDYVETCSHPNLSPDLMPFVRQETERLELNLSLAQNTG